MKLVDITDYYALESELHDLTVNQLYVLHHLVTEAGKRVSQRAIAEAMALSDKGDCDGC